MLELFSDWLGTASLLVIGLVIGIGLIVSAKLGSVLRRRRKAATGPGKPRPKAASKR